MRSTARRRPSREGLAALRTYYTARDTVKWRLTNVSGTLRYGLMIRSFKHRGLKRLYERGDRSGIRSDLLDNIEDILARLDEAWQDELCRGEVPSIHGTDRMVTDEL